MRRQKIITTACFLIVFIVACSNTPTLKNKTATYKLEYYTSGELKDSIRTVGGVEQGKCYSFYRSGNVQGVSNYVNGKVEGEVIKYRESGELEFYVCRDFRGDTYWVQKYDSVGKLLSTEGMVISPNVRLLSNDSVEVNKLALAIELYYPNPEGYNVELRYYNSMDKEESVVTKKKDEVKALISDTISLGPKSVDYYFIGAIYDLNKNLIAVDTVVREFDMPKKLE